MKILRALLVGCGGMGNVWARALADRNDIEIVGLVDINEGAAVSLADRGHLRVPIHTSLADALGALSVDVVLDTSLPETRCEVSQPREPPPRLLSEPSVSLSTHWAPIIQPLA